MSLTQARLQELLEYDGQTGVFKWRCSGKGRRLDLVAGVVSGKYTRIRVDGVLHHAHRLAYLYEKGHWPPEHVDHQEGDSDALSNLRPCSVSQNLANTKLRSDNTTGFKGVARVSGASTFKAQITVRQTHIDLGCYADPADAAKAYDAAAVQHFGEFARTNQMLGLIP